MAKITANNILTGSVTSDKLDSSVASNLAAAGNANTTATIAAAVAAAAFSTANTNAALLANVVAPPLITTVQIADSSYNVLDDTAANTTGGFVVITGSGFTNSSTVVFGSTPSPAVSYVSSTTLQAQVPALTAASYSVYVVNSNGGTAIKINALTTSLFPAWSTGATLSDWQANTTFAVALSATSDSSITYANTTALPEGTTLSANGLFSGTVTIGSDTTYTFDVKATDVENQDNTRTFSLTVTVPLSGFLWAWGGQNNVGQMGRNDVVQRSSPVQVGTDSNWFFVSSAGLVSLATRTNGTLWVWGWNVYGQLGQNDFTNRSSPSQIGSATDWNRFQISVGDNHSMALKTSGTLWTWGINTHGQLGLGDQGALNSTHRYAPTQVGGTNWTQVRAGRGFCVALQSNGTLWAWGDNTNGQLGQNNRINRSSPVQAGVATNWKQVSAGYNIAAGISADGTLWTWGKSDNSGSLGQNDLINRSTPTQVGVLTNWSLVEVGGYQVLAVKTDGTLWGWGRNGGRLGIGNSIDRSSPVQVGALTNWSQFSGHISINWSADTTIATKTDGTLWTWGGFDALGSNNAVSRSSPVQVGAGTNWTRVCSGQKLAFAIRKVI